MIRITTCHALTPQCVSGSLIFLTEPVIKALIPKGVQSVKLGLTDGFVGGAMKAALSIALNWPEPTKLFETTVEICLPILLDSFSSPVKLAMAMGNGSTWPELILILKSSENTSEDEIDITRIAILQIKIFKLLYKLYLNFVKIN